MVEIFEFLPDGLIDVAVTQSSSSVNGVIVDTQAYAGPWIYNNGNKTAVTWRLKESASYIILHTTDLWECARHSDPTVFWFGQTR